MAQIRDGAASAWTMMLPGGAPGEDWRRDRGREYRWCLLLFITNSARITTQLVTAS